MGRAWLGTVRYGWSGEGTERLPPAVWSAKERKGLARTAMGRYGTAVACDVVGTGLAWRGWGCDAMAR